MYTWFGNNFQQGCAGTVKIHAGKVVFQVVNTFTGIFFHVYAVKYYFFGGIPGFNFQVSFPANRCRMLAYLVTFWKIGVEIIFTGKIIVLGNITMQCNTQPDSEVDDFSVHYRQSTRMRQRYGAYLRIGISAKGNGITAKQFAPGEQLRMYFQANNHLVFVRIFHAAKIRGRWAIVDSRWLIALLKSLKNYMPRRKRDLQVLEFVHGP